jgi:hypothetical protein
MLFGNKVLGSWRMYSKLNVKKFHQQSWVGVIGNIRYIATRFPADGLPPFTVSVAAVVNCDRRDLLVAERPRQQCTSPRDSTQHGSNLREVRTTQLLLIVVIHHPSHKLHFTTNRSSQHHSLVELTFSLGWLLACTDCNNPPFSLRPF